MHQSRTLSIGLDVPKESMAVAYVATADHAAVVSLGHSGMRPCDLAPRLRKRPAQSPPLVLVSEAGPGGDWLSRSLPPQGHVGWGVAP